MPNIENVKNNTKDAGKGKGGSTQAGVLLLKTESTDRETANTSKIGATTGSNQKRIVSKSNLIIMHAGQRNYNRSIS